MRVMRATGVETEVDLASAGLHQLLRPVLDLVRAPARQADGREVARWGEAPEVVLEATYGWYWAADLPADAGARVHLAHPPG